MHDLRAAGSTEITITLIVDRSYARMRTTVVKESWQVRAASNGEGLLQGELGGTQHPESFLLAFARDHSYAAKLRVSRRKTWETSISVLALQSMRTDSLRVRRSSSNPDLECHKVQVVDKNASCASPSKEAVRHSSTMHLSMG